MDVTSFLGDIIPPEANRDEFIKVVTLLAFFDSIHDFWPERKTVSAEDDDDGLIDVPAERLDVVHKKLAETIASYVGQRGSTIDQVLKTTTNGQVTSVSDIENRVMKFLSLQFSPFNGQVAKITFDEILTNWVFQGDWTTYSRRVSGLPDNLEMIGGGRSVKSLSDSQRGTIAFFMLAYMNPTIQPGVAGSDVNFTFDMSPRDIGKLFMRLNQVSNAIYPQNIADSATTSFSALQGRNRFFKADGTPGNDSSIGRPLEVKSNLFSFQTFKLEFIDKKFGPVNRFGFSIKITNRATGAQIGMIDFQPKIGEQGPPVNYLMDILASGQIAGIQPKVGTAVKLPPTIYNEQLLFDLKRMGDHEQMRINNVYGITGDRLAYTYRKLLRKPGIYHSHIGFRLFRSLGGVLSPQENIFRTEQFKCKELLEKINFLLQYSAQYTDVNSELSKMRLHIEEAIGKGTVLMDPIDISTSDFATQHTQISSTFATCFVRLRMLDIRQHINNIQDKLTRTDPSTFRQFEPKLLSVAELTVGDVRGDGNLYNKLGENITTARIQVESYFNNIEELRKMNIVFDTNGKREPYYMELFDTMSYRLKKGVKNDLFNFSSGPYLHNETGMQVVIARLLVAKRARRIDAVSKTIYDNLALYLRARDSAKEAFFNPDILNAIEVATDISNGLTPSRILGLDAVAGDKNILTAITNLNALYLQTRQPQAGGWPDDEGTFRPKVRGVNREIDSKAQKKRRDMQLQAIRNEKAAERSEERRRIGREILPILQYRDIHDLFMEICIDSETTESVDELEIKWTLGINDIRAQSNEEYSHEFEESDATDIITFFLSFRNGVGSAPIFELREGPDPVYGELPRKTKGTVAIVNYIAGAMLTLQPPKTQEGLILTLLRMMSQELRNQPSLFEAPGYDGTYNQWSGIPNALQKVVIELTGYRMGGGSENRRPLYTSDTPMLPKRVRTYRARRPARKSKTRRSTA
jgi:hypothetical protein